jgi:Rne/Rng family ribonuclease
MSKELVISAASHERRVAILEEGQLVEIYIEREKEFALVGSIYKGRVTRVLPGMQSAFVDIGLDGDAFLYVSDVFENLEDYDHGHSHPEPHAPAVLAAPVEVLPGETLGRESDAGHGPEEAGLEAEHREPYTETIHLDDRDPEAHSHEAHADAEPSGAGGESHAESEPHAEPEERQPESNASAPQNFGMRYNPTQKYTPRSDRGNDRNDRGGQGQNFGRGGGGGEGGGGGRWGRRGGRRRGGRPQGAAPGGRNLPPSKYASPQGDQRGNESRGNESRGNESRGNDRGSGPRDQRGEKPRGFEHRGPEQRGFDNRRPEGARPGASAPSGAVEEPILLPGESLAKYRGKPVAASAPPVVEQEHPAASADVEESTTPSSNVPPGAAGGLPTGANVPRRSSGGLPRWLLAETGPEAESPAAEAEEHGESAQTHEVPPDISESLSAETQTETSLSEEEATALSSSLVEAKHEELQAHAKADAEIGGVDTDMEEEEETEETAEETEELHASEHTEGASRAVEPEAQHGEAEEAGDAQEPLSAHEIAEAEADAAHEEAEADVAHEQAQHAAVSGEHAEGSEHSKHSEHEYSEHAEHPEHESIAGASAPQAAEDDSPLLPGETRAPRSAGAAEPREEFPRDSARVGGNPRARFQRPFRGGGRDRGRDNRGGSGSGGGRPDRGRGRSSGGPRFERRPGGPPPRSSHQGGHSGPSRRPQLISEMLKAGQDVVIQIAKEPLGKKGARITSHVALPGRFLVYMPTVHHTGVSRKIISAENRSRLRRLVSEAGGAYPGGFIVRTAAGGATDDEIRTDIEFLGTTWNEIKQKSEERKAPSLLHRDLNLVERILRDYVSDDFNAIWIDSEEEYGKVVEFVSRFQPKLVNRVKLYTKETPIFEEFGIQHELDKALRAKVWLKSGGYIVINHTEALVAIDVNTGKFVGKGSIRLEDTIVKTNLEAVKEIVRQIRLRDLGGIIVVDFIDMEERRNREKVLSALQQSLEQDKAPSKALSFNEFGLVCITRKRTKQALERVLCQPCPYCTGSGMVKSIPTLCYEIQAEARKMATAEHEGPNLTLRVHPEIAKALKTRESMLMDELEQTSHKHIIIQSDATLHWEQYDIY